MRKAVISIDRDGKVTIDFMGFKGKTCDIAEDKLLQKLSHLKISKKKEKYKLERQLQEEKVKQHA